ncbi:MAG: hypothetical protein M1832_006034 [Thelocarpon impressellum]|nr:MAG: hypothetical protein M1832_006034 [Thelocarpon impressellum]
MAQVYNSHLDGFEIYHKDRELSPLGGPALPALGHALAGSVGSAISNVAVFPLDLVITRLQVQRHLRKDASAAHEREYQGVRDAIRKIYNDEGGLGAFYTGVVQDTGKSVLDGFLFFLAYHFLRQRRLQSHGAKSRNLPVPEELNVGFMAGSFSKFLTTPIANIVTRKQTAAMLAARSSSGDTREPSVKEIAKEIYSERGLRGFWSGYSASLVLTLNPSLTFLFYETLKRLTIPRGRRDDPGATATFFLAAMSKAMASSITYPFSLAKARSQTSRSTSAKNDGELKEGTQKASVGNITGTRVAVPSNVFSIILHIARTEGISGLYEGLAGEVLRGFFSHGITILVKEAVHKLIIQAYYLVLKALRRYPTPSEMVGRTTSTVNDTVHSAKAQATDLGQHILHTAQVLQQGAGQAAAATLDMAREGTASLSDQGTALGHKTDREDLARPVISKTK